MSYKLRFISLACFVLPVFTVIISYIISINLDGDADNLQWSDDNRSIFFSYDERGIRKIGQLMLNGEIKNIANDLGGTTLGRPYLSGSYHHSAKNIAFTYGGGNRPADLAVLMNGKVVKSGGPELALELEKKGYENIN